MKAVSNSSNLKRKLAIMKGKFRTSPDAFSPKVDAEIADMLYGKK